MSSSPKMPMKTRSPFMKRLRTYFLTGVIVTAPISITVYVTWSIIEWFDAKFLPLVPTLPKKYDDYLHLPFDLPFDIPGLGLVVAMVGLTVIGFLTANLLGRSIVRVGERLVDQMPIVRGMYNVLKQLFETVLQDSSQAFQHAALVEYPRRGLYTIGFVAGDTKGEVLLRTELDLVSVYVPTTPNPSSGFILFIPREDVRLLDMTVEQAMKYVVSVGVVVPPDLGTKPMPTNDVTPIGGGKDGGARKSA
ncbi:MAG: DUF502 domain-containing protein [Minwuia sp.]|nr:DUF502 domain-containing protein [Minwuia sp.]